MVLETEESGLFFCYCTYPFIARDVRHTVTKSVRTMDSEIRYKGGTMTLQTDGSACYVPGLCVLRVKISEVKNEGVWNDSGEM